MVITLALSTAATIFLGVVLVVVVVQIALVGPWLNLYIQARFAGAPIGLGELIKLKMSKADPRMVIFARIRAVRAGIDLSVDQLTAHHLAGGRIASVVNALIAADRGKSTSTGKPPARWTSPATMSRRP